MKTGEESTLMQLVKSLEDMSMKLEKFYKEKKYSDFDNSKKMILRIQSKILEVVEND